MCLGGGGSAYTPAPLKKPVYEAGPESPPDMVNDIIIPDANPRDQQEAARGEFDPPNRSQLKSQSSVSLGGTVTPQPARKSGGMSNADKTKRKANQNRAKANFNKRKNTRPKGAYGGASDIRLKENISEVGLSKLGYKIYEFNYKNDDTRYRGAMAQDVMTKLPEAIGVRDGFLYVDYDMIDISMEVI